MKKFSVIGNPVAHSLSPLLHNYWFKKYKIEAEYNMLEIEEADIKSVLGKIKSREISGLNVTLPFKKKIIPYLDKIVNEAKDTNSVNTVFLDENKNLIGENTDVFGFQAGYLKEIVGTDKKSFKALVIGAGGVAPSAILALKKCNINNISISNRTSDKALFLNKQFPTINIVEWKNLINETDKFDIIINATSLGLKKGNEFEMLIDKTKPNLIYIDTIYNPFQTKMIKHLKTKNIKTYNGLNMFLYQGQKSFYIWNKINPEIDDKLVKILENKIKK